MYASLAQSAEHRIFDPRAAGSNPAGGYKISLRIIAKRFTCYSRRVLFFGTGNGRLLFYKN